jgi:hypothetical protein
MLQHWNFLAIGLPSEKVRWNILVTELVEVTVKIFLLTAPFDGLRERTVTELVEVTGRMVPF